MSSDDTLTEEGESGLIKLHRQRGVLKGRLTKFNTYLESLGETPDINALKTRTLQIKDVVKTFENLQRRIESIASDDQLEAEYNARAEFEDESTELISEAEQVIRSFALVIESNRAQTVNTDNQISLRFQIQSLKNYRG